MKYSVITPTYNSYVFMRHFFAFVDRQNREDVEFIIVDDCSTDNTYSALAEYVARSSKKMLLMKNSRNSGPGISRNVGMKEAKGEWIVFLDSDDGLCDDFFEQLDGVIDRKKPDFVLYDSNVYSASGKPLSTSATVYSKAEGYLSVEETIAFAIPGIRKCFKSSLLQNGKILFTEQRRGEDFIFYTTLLSKNPDAVVYYRKEPLYRIYQRKNSLSRGEENFNIMSSIFEYLYGVVPERYHDALKTASVRLLLYGGVLQMANNGDKTSEIKRFILSYEKTNPRWYRSIGYKVLGFSKKVMLRFVRYRMILAVRLFAKIHRRLVTR